MTRLVVLIALGILVWLAIRWFVRTPPQQVIRTLKRGALWGVLLVIIVLAMTGRLHWLVAAGAAAVPFARRAWGLIRFLPLIQGLLGRYRAARAGQGPSAGQTSTVESRFLRMSLDHDSGEMDGEVLEGAFEDRFLSQMSLEELMDLLQICQQQDAESASLLSAYLDRQHPDWQQAWSGQTGSAYEEAPESPSPSHTAMSMEEARDILGVDKDASEEEIIQAHRRLMHKLHPDRGGSDYLASKINLAKDCLLNK
jgi:DnaJ-domain-containing protein 1